MERLISKMLYDGFIRPSSIPFSHLVLLVKEKDGTWRFCVDYVVVTAITVKDSFPIPTVDVLIHELHGAKIDSNFILLNVRDYKDFVLSVVIAKYSKVSF
nr:transposon Ty3-I Gag-Pol polyprotein [Tanacetum cinerariifolium]